MAFLLNRSQGFYVLMMLAFLVVALSAMPGLSHAFSFALFLLGSALATAGVAVEQNLKRFDAALLASIWILVAALAVTFFEGLAATWPWVVSATKATSPWFGACSGLIALVFLTDLVRNRPLDECVG